MSSEEAFNGSMKKGSKKSIQPTMMHLPITHYRYYYFHCYYNDHKAKPIVVLSFSGGGDSRKNEQRWTERSC